MAVGTGSSSKAGLNSFYRCHCLYRFYSLNSFYGFYSPVYHYLSEVDHAAEDVVEELVVTSDEAESRSNRPAAL